MSRYASYRLRSLVRQLLNCLLRRNYFLSFIEEYWPGQREGTFIGRIEVSAKEGRWELGIGTFDRDGVERLRVSYDFKTVNERVYRKIKHLVEGLNNAKK